MIVPASVFSTIICLAIMPCDALNKTRLKEQTLEMFHHAFWAYMTHAYPADELMPISCQGRFRGVTPSRGDVDDALGNFSLSLIDALDTLAVLGDYETFEMAATLITTEVKFDSDLVVSVFETNIRVVGGLLSGHLMTKILQRELDGFMTWYDDQLLLLAKQMADRLLPAFDTKTGVPYPRVNLKYGLDGPAHQLRSQQDTCTACAGSMILEFAALSRLTSDPIYERKARHAMDFLWQQRHSVSDLMGTVLNVQNGDWIRRDSGIGAGIDSYYEYCLKAYILLGDEAYLHRFNKHYDAIMKYINQGPTMVDVHMHNPTVASRTFMDALLAFWPGLQVLKGDVKSAVEMHEILYQVVQKHNFLPEAFTHDFQVHWGQHPLRPEFVESTYFLYKATKDEHYLKIGEEILNTLNKHVRVDCGFAGVKDVRTMSHEDRMDSFVLAETFKYLYLLFADRNDLLFDVDDFVFTTEAHFLPLSVSSHKSFPKPKSHPAFHYQLTASSESEPDQDDNLSRVCPNTDYFHDTKVGSKASYASVLRDRLKNWVLKSSLQGCSKSQNDDSSNAALLNPSEFDPSNSDHIRKLKSMGITITAESGGKMQLVHTSNKAQSANLADQGLRFMQIMLSLINEQSPSQEATQPLRVVQVISAPFFGNWSETASPAQFGLNLDDLLNGVTGELMEARPRQGCSPFYIPGPNKIVIIERGSCMFVEKVRNAQQAGALGVIILDYENATDNNLSSVFAMSGDGNTDVTIPSVFLTRQKGQKLLDILHGGQRLFVRIADRARHPMEIFALWLKGFYRTFKSSTTDNALNELSISDLLIRINDVLSKSSKADKDDDDSKKSQSDRVSTNPTSMWAISNSARYSNKAASKSNLELLRETANNLSKLNEFLTMIEEKLRILKSSRKQH